MSTCYARNCLMPSKVRLTLASVNWDFCEDHIDRATELFIQSQRKVDVVLDQLRLEVRALGKETK